MAKEYYGPSMRAIMNPVTMTHNGRTIAIGNDITLNNRDKTVVLEATADEYEEMHTLRGIDTPVIVKYTTKSSYDKVMKFKASLADIDLDDTEPAVDENIEA
jgi:hypothetical protein